MKTHEVFNQIRPLEDYNLITTIPALVEMVTKLGGDWADEALATFGGLVGSAEVIEHGRLANENPPVLKAFDAYGRRINVVEYHPSYHDLMSMSMAHGLWQPGRTSARGRWLFAARKLYDVATNPAMAVKSP